MHITPHEHLPLTCFRGQKQALVNAIKYVCSPTPLRQQTPQREFALQRYNKDLDYANLFCIFIEKGQKKEHIVL